MEIVNLPTVITKEEKWYVAYCPILEIATQGKTEKEVRDNMRDLIEEYMEDPDTLKPELKTLRSTSVTITSFPIKMKGFHEKVKSITST
jgi:predicted RNase H-like HicB family nuclease